MPWPSKPALERFTAKYKVDDKTGCWNWTAATDKDGYGVFSAGTRPNGRVASTRSHRWGYEHYRGAIPEGLEIDHLCRNHACCNPAHLEAVTPQENQRRGDGTFTVVHAKKTLCPQGHPYDADNTFLTATGGRACRECNRVKSREYQRQKAAAREATSSPRAA